jgi:hypothetical protein
MICLHTNFPMPFSITSFIIMNLSAKYSIHVAATLLLNSLQKQSCILFKDLLKYIILGQRTKWL